MKAILEFDLPEEKDEFRHATEGVKWFIFAHDFDQYMRSQLKYNDKLTNEEYKAIQSVRDKFYELLNEDNLSLD